MLLRLGYGAAVIFHHDGFEFNDGSLPPHEFSIERRLAFYRDVDRLIYLERDPRDTIVSLFYQITGRFSEYFQYGGSISDFIRDDYFGAKTLRGFRDMWRQIITRREVLKITYEDIHGDTAKALRTLLDYLDLNASDAEITEAVKAAAFSEMRRVELEETVPEPWLRLRNGFPKVRKGRIEGFYEELQPEDIAYLNEAFFKLKT